MTRFVAVDWSGAIRGERKKIWLAEASGGNLTLLECGRRRAEVAEYLVHRAKMDRDMIIGFDFAFSLPQWFGMRMGALEAPDLWPIVERDGESWLKTCNEPFWGRKGRKCPVDIEQFRWTDRNTPAVAGIRPKSVFQINGGGAVGTGSLRGMPVLSTLRNAGFAVWPFDAPRKPFIIEIYPRALTGAVRKNDAAVRQAYLQEKYACLTSDMLSRAMGCEDAFDAAVSALVMEAHAGELAGLSRLSDACIRAEGSIWLPTTRHSLITHPPRVST